uniref:Retrotransposon gag domain-containing protein n=1 Tax=Tanacetum cinerariifolium TaxID=118510 RepID=A0A6L2M0N1_TANCI|nr:hypothetical protein [Tanacetum cinerariifolium]
MKQNGVSDDALRLSLFPYSLKHHAIAWYDRLPRNSIYSFYDMMRKLLSKYFPPSMVTNLRNEILKFEQKLHESLFEAWEHYKLSIDRCKPSSLFDFEEVMNNNHNQGPPPYNGPPLMLEMMNMTFSEMMKQFQTVKAVDTKCETCGGPYSFTECPAVSGYAQKTAYATTGNYNSGAGPLVSPPPPSRVVDREPETITDHVFTGSTNNFPPLVVHPSPASTFSTLISSSKMPEMIKDTVQPSTKNIQPPVAQTQVPINEPIVAPKPKSTIPYPSRANKQKLCEKDNNLALKFVEIFRNLHFKISFTDALLHMPKFSLMFKSLLNKKVKLVNLATTLVNENCLALSLPKLTSTEMNLELVDRSTNRPAGIAKDIFVKIGKFHFLTDFVVVDYVVDPRVPLILGRPFLRTERALIDVYSEELTLREGDILYLEKLLNEDPSLNIFPIKTKDLKQVDATITKPSIDEPPEPKIKELPSHLEYTFLEGTDKLPVIISKELKDEEKSPF